MFQWSSPNIYTTVSFCRIHALSFCFPFLYCLLHALLILDCRLFCPFVFGINGNNEAFERSFGARFTSASLIAYVTLIAYFRFLLFSDFRARCRRNYPEWKRIGSGNSGLYTSCDRSKLLYIALIELFAGVWFVFHKMHFLQGFYSSWVSLRSNCLIYCSRQGVNPDPLTLISHLTEDHVLGILLVNILCSRYPLILTAFNVVMLMCIRQQRHLARVLGLLAVDLCRIQQTHIQGFWFVIQLTSSSNCFFWFHLRLWDWSFWFSRGARGYQWRLRPRYWTGS